MYITPVTHRFLEKEGEIVRDELEEELLTKIVQMFLVVRPKFYVPSDGTTWASDYMRLRHENPQFYEVGSDSFEKYSLLFRSLCAKVKDNVAYFVQATMKEDVSCVTGKESCRSKHYENKQIEHLLNASSKARDAWETKIKLENAITHLRRKFVAGVRGIDN